MYYLDGDANSSSDRKKKEYLIVKTFWVIKVILWDKNRVKARENDRNDVSINDSLIFGIKE